MKKMKDQDEAYKKQAGLRLHGFGRFTGFQGFRAFRGLGV